MRTLNDYQSKFIEFLISAEVLSFGEFSLKSGRKAPYFVNTGKLNSGPTIQELGRFYAQHITAQGWNNADVIFGPSYKGIPLCVGTAIALSALEKRSIGFTFDRKESKDHGDGGLFVGAPLTPTTKMVLVEDVVTAGTTLQKIIPLLRSLTPATITGVVVAVDRCERGLSSSLSAVQEAEKTLNITVAPVVTIHDILTHLESESALSSELRDRIRAYVAQYGA